ncbi:aldolase [Robertmurraya beringensis]|uniref:Aldolase n=1 Tax=Robertmurraya beringensis TaxID=641660 RepID=A0ABV6L1Z8_9BACI
MNSIANKVIAFEAFGLNILSEIPLKELSQRLVDQTSIDICIKEKCLKNQWNTLDDQENAFVITEDKVMFEVPNVAIFSVENGNSIYVTPLKDYDEDVVRLYLLGTGMGTILLQRKSLPLHGSALEFEGKAIAIVGDSGAGKSTTASALMKEGFNLLSDDVIALALTDDMDVMVTPAYPQQKLWIESIEHLGMSTNNYRSIYGRETKFNVPVNEQFVNRTIPLYGIFELVKSSTNEEVEFKKLDKLESFYSIYSNTFRNFLIRPLHLLDWHFEFSAKILDRVPTYKLVRPDNQSYSVNKLLSIILQNVKEEGGVNDVNK